MNQFPFSVVGSAAASFLSVSIHVKMSSIRVQTAERRWESSTESADLGPNSSSSLAGSSFTGSELLLRNTTENLVQSDWFK